MTISSTEANKDCSLGTDVGDAVASRLVAAGLVGVEVEAADGDEALAAGRRQEALDSDVMIISTTPIVQAVLCALA
jgi:hypothetical protein